ncbi:MAG: hypothetical protein N7Q72_03460 [Spiroplasma sp. Tabriz.8]|nr:hypothetical protein [Spiroplasma sp. Tabriz.8]
MKRIQLLNIRFGGIYIYIYIYILVMEYALVMQNYFAWWILNMLR